MKLSQIALPVLALALGAPAFLTAHAQYPDQGRGGWDAPPQEFRAVQRQGFHDGLEAARRDMEARRPANVEAHEELRHPPVDRELRDDYRDGFRRGYEKAFAHAREMMEHPPMPMAPPPPAQYQERAWDMPPQEFREFQRTGFHDGIEAARRDFADHREPEVEAKREFREPPVPREARDDYRDAFRRGYVMAFKHFREERR
jgi:hypothetical protein